MAMREAFRRLFARSAERLRKRDCDMLLDDPARSDPLHLDRRSRLGPGNPPGRPIRGFEARKFPQSDSRNSPGRPIRCFESHFSAVPARATAFLSILRTKTALNQ